MLVIETLNSVAKDRGFDDYAALQQARKPVAFCELATCEARSLLDIQRRAEELARTETIALPTARQLAARASGFESYDSALESMERAAEELRCLEVSRDDLTWIVRHRETEELIWNQAYERIDLDYLSYVADELPARLERPELHLARTLEDQFDAALGREEACGVCLSNAHLRAVDREIFARFYRHREARVLEVYLGGLRFHDYRAADVGGFVDHVARTTGVDCVALCEIEQPRFLAWLLEREWSPDGVAGVRNHFGDCDEATCSHCVWRTQGWTLRSAV